MDKITALKTIISDFFERELSDIKARDIILPTNVEKIISVIGPRRAGKTHLLFHLIHQLRKEIPVEQLVYINFEDDRLFPLELSDMDDILSAYYELFPANIDKKVWFFFDEVQEVPNWELFIRRMNDTVNCHIYLTGSSAKLLSRELASSLRGRTLVYELFSLSFPEFLRFNNISANPDSSKGKVLMSHWFEKWLSQGGFPELVFLPEELHKRTIQEYTDLMLYRDIVERFSIKNPTLLKYVFKFIVQNLANSLSINKVFNDLKSQGFSLSRNTLYEYFSYLEETFTVFKVDKWDRSVRVQAVNPSKYYLVDPAFKYSMTITRDEGRILENAVFMHLKRQGIQPNYVLNKQEVDFYWEGGTPINVCLDLTAGSTRTREINGMVETLNKLNLPEGIVITRNQEEEIIISDKKISVIAAWKWMLE